MSIPPHPKQGFTLLEVMLATTLFAVVAVGFALILNGLIRTHTYNQRERHIRQILQNCMDDVLRQPSHVPGEKELESSDPAIRLVQRVEDVTLTDRDDKPFRGVRKVTIAAEWSENAGKETREAEFYVPRR